MDPFWLIASSSCVISYLGYIVRGLQWTLWGFPPLQLASPKGLLSKMLNEETKCRTSERRGRGAISERGTLNLWCADSFELRPHLSIQCPRTRRCCTCFHLIYARHSRIRRHMNARFGIGRSYAFPTGYHAAITLTLLITLTSDV